MGIPKSSHSAGTRPASTFRGKCRARHSWRRLTSIRRSLSTCRFDLITLSGTLEFATPDGETFVMRPGDVLVAVDHVGKGHKWRLIDDQPWRRAYVVLKPGAKDSFVAKNDT
jgi:hypothetical protein